MNGSFDPSALGKDFVWGASTSSYQIEGAVLEDGRGASIWDVFCRTPGKVENGESGDIACDHYHRYSEDVALMRELGVAAYRFSVAWPRIFPEGKGKLNSAGLDFYQRLVDELLKNQIDPWICLYHWDLPQALQDKGGWTNRDIASWFTDYAIAVSDRLGDRVHHWVMLNEPMVVSYLGCFLGVHAPGLKDRSAFFGAMHHLNLALGLGLTALRTQGGDWRLGTVVNFSPGIPEGEKATELAQRHDAILYWSFLDPVLKGEYPEAVREYVEPFIQSGDLAAIRHPLDFVGLNYYFPSRLQPSAVAPFGFEEVEAPVSRPKTAMGWEIRPESLTDLLVRMKQRYALPPLFITENGAAFNDCPQADGSFNDQDRIDYIADHLAAVVKAKQRGVDVRGYFVWSLLDNFEWAYGYWPRFGIVRVEFDTLQRLPKASFRWLAKSIRACRNV
ncbi:MAG: GH1 family beta-glucosidase [Chthoniobacterales bacterium]